MREQSPLTDIAGENKTRPPGLTSKKTVSTPYSRESVSGLRPSGHKIGHNFEPVQAGPGQGEHPGRWLVRQVLDDPDAGREWAIVCEVDLVESAAEGVAVVHTVGVERL